MPSDESLLDRLVVVLDTLDNRLEGFENVKQGTSNELDPSQGSLVTQKLKDFLASSVNTTAAPNPITGEPPPLPSINVQTIQKVELVKVSGDARGYFDGGLKALIDAILMGGGGGGGSQSPPPKEREPKEKDLFDKIFQWISMKTSKMFHDPGKARQVSRERTQKNLGKARDFYNSAANAVTNPNELEGFAEITSTIANMFGPAGQTVGTFIKALADTTDRLKKWGEELHQGNIRFAEYSAAMAAVQARQEVRDIQLSQERGNRRADTAERVAQQLNRLERNTSVVEDFWADIKGDLYAGITGVFNDVLEMSGIIDAMKLLHAWYKWLRGKDDKEKQGNFADWLNMEAEYDQVHNRPMRDNRWR